MKRSNLTMPAQCVRVRNLATTFILTTRLLCSSPQRFSRSGVSTGSSAP